MGDSVCPYSTPISVSATWTLEFVRGCQFSKASCCATVFEHPEVYHKCSDFLKKKDSKN